ncbi:MAG: ATP-binding protein [Anaerovoracaceae bacterium]|nr:ATP-binding protein [Anaerovoracaceae bacterium]
MKEWISKRIDKEKVKSTLLVAIFVSIASQISFHIFSGGFIVALSVLIMAIFMYLLDNVTPTYIAICSGIFSPLLRMLFLVERGIDIQAASMAALPDIAFFFTYAMAYPLIYKFIIKEPRSLVNYPTALFLCDFFSNMSEMTMRSIEAGKNLIGFETIAVLLLVAFVRTTLVQVILIAVERYTTVLLKRENLSEYKRLLGLAALIEGELQIMKKSVREIDGIMKEAFELYKDLGARGIDKATSGRVLAISQHAHEIRGDFQGIISTIATSFVDQYDDPPLTIKEIIGIERELVMGIAGVKSRGVSIVIKAKINFLVDGYFKMMSIVRNLMINAIESFDCRSGNLTVDLDEEGDNYVLKFIDNGSGMTESQLESIFLPGFSTKFSEDTGKIQRGIGLSVVKDYVENGFGGKITVSSEKGKGTVFTITFKKNLFREVEQDEILHS